MKANEGYFPMIIYKREDVGIIYKVDAKGNATEATAMTVEEAGDRMETYKQAADTTTSKGRMN